MADVTRIEIATRPGFADSRGLSVARAIREHLGLAVTAVRTRDVFHVEPALPPSDARRVADEFAGPVVRQGAVGRLEDGPFDVAVSVGFKPGVTDPVGKSARVAIEDLLGRKLGEHGAVYASRVYLLSGVSRDEAARIATKLLANEVIERIGVQTLAEWTATPPDLTVPRVVDHAPRPAAAVPLLGLDDAALARLSREKLLALTVEELTVIRAFFEKAAADPRRRKAGLGADPTDAELECLAQTWSEHCKHKIFNATITYREAGKPPETIRSLFKELIRGTTTRVNEAIQQREGKSWLVSVFHDNAGVIAATEAYHLVYKVETHNSPSALDPYGGAITGIVGVNRDPFGTGLGADLLSNVWGYCFGPPDWSGELPPGLLHPRRIREGVHHGVIDGGNQSGIPYGRGWELFDERYLGKPLVYCGTVGRMPAVSAGRRTEVKLARPGDRIVMVGGRIGKDGIHGATFSSAELTEESPVQAVQIGDPITQKMMFDFLLEARDAALYSSITDNGAGGLSSSVGEMARQPGGAWLDLQKAPLKYQGLAAWEILVSEAQERMTLAVPPDRLDAFLALARTREVEATDLGAFTDDGLFEVRYGSQVVALLPLQFLHDGDPELRIEAEWAPAPVGAFPELPLPASPAEGTALVQPFLARHNLRSNELLARTYDHEVKGLTVVKPWIGVHRDVPADASVFMIAHDALPHGYALSEGVFPTYSDHDAHAMAQAGVDLAVRRLIAAGVRSDRIAALDNYCWPDPLPGPKNPDALHKAAQLVRASRGLSEICVAYGVPLVSGKDSMKNDAVVGGKRISIPPTLLASAIGLVPDVRRAVTLEAAVVGEVLILVGDSHQELGGTEWAAHRGLAGGQVPRCRPAEFWPRYEAVARAIRDELVVAAHAVGRGGLLHSLFLMARAAGMGLGVNLGMAPLGPDTTWEGLLLGETPGRFLLACRPEKMDRLRKQLHAVPHAVVGSYTASERLKIGQGPTSLVDAAVADLARTWKREGERLVSRPVRVLIPVGFGFNCEDETAAAFRMVGAEVDLVHLTDLFARRSERRIPDYQVLAFVGGFSYGDHVASGFVAATRVRAHLQEDLSAFLAGGGRLLGICNGFQVLVRLGVLPGPDAGPHDFVPRAALTNNDRLGYRDAWVKLAVDRKSTCVWTHGLTRLEVPARHGEGKFVLESDAALDRLEHRGQVAFRYVDAAGQPTEAWPANPNGSAHGVAGVTDATGRILGLMPHPDAFLYPWHHPDYARRKKDLEGQEPGGLAIFRAGVTGL